MKVLLVGLAALVVGLLGGTLVSGMRVKSEVLEVMEDSIAAEREAMWAAEHGAMPGADQAGAVSQPPEEGPTSDSGEDDTAAAASPDASEAGAVAFASEPGAQGVGTASGRVALPGSQMPGATDSGAVRSPGAGEEQVNEGAKRLSKIFGAMDPQDAADVLQQLGDDEIEEILEQMTERRAAPILELFDPERAAALSRIVLTPKGER